MSTTEFESDKIIDFQQRRREIVIREVAKFNRLSPEEMDSIITMHEFLIQVDYSVRNNLIDDETAAKVAEEMKLVREKFDELFEIIKEELFI